LPAGFGGHERDRAERAIAGRERHDEERSQAEGAETSEMVLIAGEPPQQLVGNDRNDLRPAAADDLRHRILRQLAIPMAHCPDRLHLRRIHVGDRQTVEPALRIHDVDGAPVSQARHGQTAAALSVAR
jgi:hypothetical protein